MKRPGDDGYSFPCGSSHSQIDYAEDPRFFADKKVRFGNNNSGTMYNTKVSDVIEFRGRLIRQLELVERWMQQNRK